MKHKKLIGISLTAVALATVGAIGITSVSSNFVNALFNRDTQNTYSLSLNSSNKVSSSGDHTIYSATGGAVTFTYTSVSSNASGHTTIANNGTIVNKQQITSIESFKATFTGGTLQARIAYVVGTWGEYFTLNSGVKVDFGSKPYFLEMKATGGAVNLASAVFTYSCEVNPDAEPHDEMGSYDIVFATHDSDSGTVLTTTTAMDEIEEGSEYVSGFGYISYVYPGIDGLKISSSKNDGYFLIEFDTSKVTETIESVTVYSSCYKSETDVEIRLYANDGDTKTGQVPASTGGDVAINQTLESLYIDTDSGRAYVYAISLNYGGSYTPGAPENPTAYETGFTADDANKNSYSTNSIFANDNALVVKSIMSDSTMSVIPSSLYSYVIKDSNNQTINPNAKFPAVGTYTLTVTYGEYVPVNITLNVGEYIYMVDVSGSMSKVTFNTSNVLSDYLATGLTANVTYSDDSTQNDIPYAELSAYGLGLKLLNKNISHDITKPFGIAGSWSLRIYSLTDEANIYYDIALTVNAIPVQTITLDTVSRTLYVDDELQLVATVNPSTATNPAITWTSSNENVATVDDGLVTAIAVGGATITASAVDGSGVFGTCIITVEAAPVVTGYELYSGALTEGDYIIYYDGKAMKNTVSSNRLSYKEVTPENDVITDYDDSIVWHIAPSGDYWTIYSEDADKYAAATGTKNQAQLLASGTDNKSLWTVSGTSTYEFVNKNNAANSVNANLRNNGTYGFATYSTSTGGALSLYKGGSGGTPTTPIYPTSIDVTGTSSIAIGGTSQLSVSYSPSETNVKNVTFTSSNSSVASVSNTGLVTGVSAGSARITATAEAESGTVSDYIDITITPIAVSGVMLSDSTATVKVSKTVTLVASISPANATNKNVTWSSSNASIATVSNQGVVTGVSAGTATITVTTVDGNKTASCVVTVTASSGEEEFTITYGDLPTAYSTSSTVYTADSGIKFQAYNCANYSSKMQWRANSGYLQNTEALELQSLTINDRESNTLTVYGSNTAGTFTVEITGNNDVYDLTGYCYFKIARTFNGAAYCSSISITTGTPTPTDPTSIILSPTSAEVGIGGTKQLSVSYVPGNANQNKEITWKSSNTNVATVSSTGLVSVKSTATAGQTATITARLTNLTNISATCVITVVEQQKDDHTVLVYICGADLESENGLATGDIEEMLKISGQPDDVNIVIETGGAKSWSSTYGISSTKLERWHIANRQLVKDDSLTYASMGLSSTLQSFIEYGLKNYPAERTGLILWNHGGGMRGVCYDEKKNDDVLKSSEVKSAVSGALNNCNLSGQKLEWIGYDACLMAVQDIAETNSAYFNYMIASEESEAGYGWDYDTWVDDLYAKKTTPVILKAIVDGFISDNGGANSSSGDQTLSYMNLSYAAAYKNAWETMAEQLYSKVTSSNRSTFNSAIKSNVKHFADSDYDYFCTFDAWDFIDKLANNSAFSLFRLDASYTNAVKTAFNNLVAYSVAQKGAGVAKGLCMYWCNDTQYSDVSTYYTTSETNFTWWRKLNVDRGYHA